jgi:hypothetical protein
VHLFLSLCAGWALPRFSLNSHFFCPSSYLLLFEVVQFLNIRKHDDSNDDDDDESSPGRNSIRI